LTKSSHYYTHTCTSVTKQYNLISAKGR